MNEGSGRRARSNRALSFRALAVSILVLNAVGLYWIRSEVRAANRSGVRVERVLPTRRVDSASELTLVFDRAVVGGEQTGLPLAESPYRLEPRREGHWTWTGPDRLAFVLAEPLPPGRVFTLAPSADFESVTGFALRGRERFELRTRPLRVDWVGVESARADEAVVGFRFDQPVAPADLARHLVIRGRHGGGSLELEPLSAEPAAELAVRVERGDRPGLYVEIEPGLRGAGAELGLEKARTFELDLPRRFAPLEARAKPARRENRCSLEIRFSELLALDQELPRLEIEPAVECAHPHVRGSRIVADGPFECGRSYRVRLPATVLSRAGETLGGEHELAFEVPERDPDIHFPQYHGILSPRGNLELEMTVTGIEGLELGAWRLHENNLVAHLHGGQRSHTSRALGERTIPLELEPNRVHSTLLDLEELLVDPLGAYRIQARATGERWTRDWAVVRITDLGLNVKREREGLLVWASSISTATPLEGVAVEARSANNQVLAGALTDPDGLARLAVPEGHPDGGAFAVIASQGGDTTFLVPGRRAWVFDDVDVSGRRHELGLDALLYTERGVYRPGDEVHLTGILRDDAGAIPAEVPLTLTVARPDGKLVRNAPLEAELDAQGIFHASLPTDPLGQTGEYVFRVLSKEREVGRTSALVEAFVPARIEVRAEVVEPGAGKAALGVEVEARYLFGRAASGLPVKALPRWRRVDYRSEAFPDFGFAEEGPHPEHGGDETEGVLDGEGRAVLAVAAPEEELPGLWRAVIHATVTEPGSRSVSRRVEGRYDSATRHLGLRSRPGNRVPVGEPFAIDWQLVTPEDEAAPPAEVELRLLHVVTEYELGSVDGRPVWQPREVVTELERLTERAASSGTATFTCPGYGSFHLVAVDPASGVRTRLELRAGGSDHPRVATTEGGPERLELALDRAAYTPGDRARVTVRGAFDGRLLVTLEADRVLEARVLPFEGGSAEVELDVPAGLRGGAFVCASLIRPVDPDDSSWLPHRARGLARLVTEHEAHRVAVEIEAPERARPGEALAMRVRTDAGSRGRVHLWAVDEGILQATGETVPDPHAHFFAPRRSGVSTSDDFGDLLPDHRRPASLARIGGDAAERAARRRRGSAPTTRREAAVVWREAIELDEGGVADVVLPAPELRGALRWMAVVVDGDRYGAAERRVELSTPLVITASAPRFATSNDRFAIPVRLANTTSSTMTVDLDGSAMGSLELVPPGDGEGIELPPGGEALRWFRARATTLGPVEATFRARGEGIDEVARVGLDVRPTAPLHRTSQLVALSGGERARIDPGEGFLVEGLSCRLEVCSAPEVELRPALEMLLRYPYGCVEQTTSRLFALLHAAPLLGDGEGGDSAYVRRMIAVGIGRLASMQTRGGGLAYWPGGRHASSWGSAYAGSFLAEARGEGYALDDELTQPLLDYLAARLREGDESPSERALLARVLAAFGRPHPGWNARLTEQLDELDLCGRAHLAAAWLACGRRDRAAECLPEDTIRRVARTSTSGRITSEVRQKGALLAVLLELDPEHPWIDPLVSRLVEARENGQWRNTLENASALAALARYQLLQPPPEPWRGRLVLPDGAVYEVDSETPVVLELDEPDGLVEIEIEGAGTARLLVTSEGFTVEDPEPFDHELRVRRRWLAPDGEELDGRDLEVGDLVLVEVCVQAPVLSAGERARNLAIVDPLPAGLEVENPRLAGSVKVAGRRTPVRAGSADRVEFLDDRVLIFTGAAREEEIYRYALRASAAGTFTIPPIQASSMYDPGFASLGETATLRIER